MADEYDITFKEVRVLVMVRVRLLYLPVSKKNGNATGETTVYGEKREN